MKRSEFLGAILGVPFLGWVRKLDKGGKDEVHVIEPVSVPYVWENNYSATIASTTTTASYNGIVHYYNGTLT